MSRRPISGKKTNLSQYGLLDIPDINDNDDELLDLSDDDMDLEAELAAISGGELRRRPRKPPPIPAVNLDVMVAESLKDLPSDDEGSGDDEDPDLLNELQALAIEDEEAPSPLPRSVRPAPPIPGVSLSTDSSTISMLQDRITNYTVAEKNAKANGETSRARRFSRGLKTLMDLLKQAKAGKPVKYEDIPPPVGVGRPADAPAIPQPEAPQPEAPQPEAPQPEAPESPPPVEANQNPLIDFGAPDSGSSEPLLPGQNLLKEEFKQNDLKIIMDRKTEFKLAALDAKKCGDKNLALGLLKVSKQFDLVIEAYNKGESMNLDELPTVAMITTAIKNEKQEESTQNSAAPEEVLVTATTLKEGLQQRLEVFRTLEAKAKEENNTSKARRMNRIVKQYVDAIKQHERGLPIDADALPTPAGLGPLPSDVNNVSSSSREEAPKKQTQNEQLVYLLQQQKRFKEAALYLKKKGDLDSARNYLRGSKLYDPFIAQARAGEVVDMSKLPPTPSALRKIEEAAKTLVVTDDAVTERAGASSVRTSKYSDTTSLTSSDSEWVDVAQVKGDFDNVPIDAAAPGEDIYTRMLRQLETQCNLCKTYIEYCRKAGNVSEGLKFEKLYSRVKEDYDVITVAKMNNQEVPKFHYVMREFAMLQCNSELSPSELGLTIIRGIAYNVPNPKEVDTYVKFEFPFPQEAPVWDRTAVVKDTDSPEYNADFVLNINRSRACVRVFKRHGIKFEVWSKGGWFRSDVLLGTANVKLAPLREHVTLHDSFPLMDGRRPAGGVLEIKLRVRTPLEQEEVKTTKHRWLVIDDVEMA